MPSMKAARRGPQKIEAVICLFRAGICTLKRGGDQVAIDFRELGIRRQCRKLAFRASNQVIAGAYVRRAGRKRSKQVKRRVWCCVPRMRELWPIVRSPISNASRWTWREARRCS